MSDNFDKMQLIREAHSLGVFDNSVIKNMATNVLKSAGIGLIPMSIVQHNPTPQHAESSPLLTPKDNGAVFARPPRAIRQVQTDSLSSKVSEANPIADTEDGGILSPWLTPTPDEIKRHGLPQETESDVGIIKPKQKPTELLKPQSKPKPLIK